MPYVPQSWVNQVTDVDAAHMQHIEDGILTADTAASSLAALGPGAPVLTLPGSPSNGQQVILTDSLTVPTYNWLLQYNSAITDANKWICVGGAPATSEILTAQTTALTATFQDLATVGPSFTIPRAGIYDIEFSVDASITASPGGVAAKLGAAATSLNDGGFVLVAVGGDGSAAVALIRRTLAAADLVKLQYQGQTPSANTYLRRRLFVMPVRVA